MNHPVLQAAEAALGVELNHEGDPALLDQPRRALLISRGERCPKPDTPWVAGAVAAAKQLADAGEALVCGAGRTAFDLALWTCAQEIGAAVVALERSPDSAAWREFLPARHLLVWPREKLKGAVSLRRRDLLIGWLADRAYAIRVRKGGHMADVAESLQSRGCKVATFISSPFHANLSPATCHMSPAANPQSEIRNPQLEPWDYLTHYTREPDGAWPGEPRGEYLRWLASGVPYEPRDAFAALCRILHERRLRACGRLMPGHEPMVCFTACTPNDALALRRWRRGLMRWSLTRYGLAVRRGALESLGARPVAYAARDEIKCALPEARRFMQIERSGNVAWSDEAEWRIAGDVELSRLPREALLALVAKDEEARRIEDAFGIAARVIG